MSQTKIVTLVEAIFQLLLKPNLITCLDKVKLKLPSWEDGKTLEISTITVHPHFNDSSYDNDLAVLTLAAAVDLTQLRPICLPSPGTGRASNEDYAKIRENYTILNVKALEGAFNQEKALVEVFSAIVKLNI